MWRQEKQNNNNLKRILALVEIAVMAIVVISLASYLWKNTGIGNLDPSLQIAVLGIFCFLFIIIANYVIDRIW